MLIAFMVETTVCMTAEGSGGLAVEYATAVGCTVPLLSSVRDSAASYCLEALTTIAPMTFSGSFSKTGVMTSNTRPTTQPVTQPARPVLQPVSNSRQTQGHTLPSTWWIEAVPCLDALMCLPSMPLWGACAQALRCDMVQDS